MESLFEPSSYLDPTPYDPSSFLTFSSFADLTASPPSISDTWDDVFYSPPSCSSSSFSSSAASSFSPCSTFNKHQPTLSGGSSLLGGQYLLVHSANSASSDCSSPDLSFDPFEIAHSAFESTPGIFHTPSKGGSSKLSAADAGVPGLTHRVSGSGDSTWDSPLITPALNGLGFTSPQQSSKAAFSWEDAPSTLASSSSYTPPTTAVSPVPLRVASNPNLGAHKNPRAIRPVNSMPALKEEVDTFQWFDGSGLDTSEPLTDENLVDNFDWVFGDYGLGESLPIDGTIFAAFKENEQNATSPATTTAPPTTTLPSSSSSTDNQFNTNDLSSWYAGASSMQAASTPAMSLESYSFGPSYGIDPTALGGSSSSGSRPATAPGAEGGEGSSLLSASAAEPMSRSATAPGFGPSRSAPTSETFSYDPQSFQASAYIPQQQASFPPAQVLPIRALPQRRASTHGLTISINQPNYSTYSQPSELPTPPHSAPFSSASMSHAQAMAQSAYSPYTHLQAPVAMARAGTQPLPTTRRMSGSAGPSSSGGGAVNMPAHLVRAQAIVQMQEAKDEQKRQEMRRAAASRRVGMAEASVMQPLTTTAPQPPPHHAPAMPRSQPAIVGWGGPSSLPSASHMPSAMSVAPGPILTSQPLIVHPPPQFYSAAPHHTYHPHLIHPPHPQAQPQLHRVHPPPHPGMGGGPGAGVGLGMGVPRPMARLPSSPTKGSRKVTSPTKRSPSAAKARRAPMQPGGFSWGEATFINFTPDDAEKLLTGVAPSGSQAKRKREEDAARSGAAAMSMGMAGGLLAGGEALAVDMDREGSKRSRTGE